MNLHLRLPSGIGLMLVGSGIYWALSSILIGSPTALAPGLLNGPDEIFALFYLGFACIVIGFPFLISDARKLGSLFQQTNGWLFTIPIGLAATDIELTFLGLSTGQVVELNPFVRATANVGGSSILLFLLSYIGLSEGLGVLMLGLGRRLYGLSKSEKYLPYALVCGVAAFGPFSNLAIIILGSLAPAAVYPSGIIGSGLLTYGTYWALKN